MSQSSLCGVVIMQVAEEGKSAVDNRDCFRYRVVRLSYLKGKHYTNTNS
jgi:hypothetical protein